MWRCTRAQFLGDIAFMLETFAVAGGLLLLGGAWAAAAGRLARAAGLVLLLAGVGGALCTTWFWFKYHGAGEFEHSRPVIMQPMAGARPGMHGMPGMHGGPPQHRAP